MKEKQRQIQQLEEELGKGKKEEKKDNSHTYNLLDIKKAVQIKPSDYNKAISTKKFQFVQKPCDGTQNYGTGDQRGIAPKHKGKGLRSKYDLV